MLPLAVLLLLLAVPAGASAAREDSLAAARDLYTSADYGEALAMLTRLRTTATAAEDLRAIDEYRAFALFALGRTAEAELVVEGIALADPLWTLPAGEAPPRLAALFAQARDRALPGVLRQRLAAARALYAEKRYDAAAEGFTSILVLLDDPVMAKAAGADLSSMTAIATGFRDLSLAADEQQRTAAARAAEKPADKPVDATTAAKTPADSAAAPGGTAAPTAAPGGATEAATAAPSTSEPSTSERGAADGRAPATPSPTDIVPPVPITQVIPRPSDISLPMGGKQTILLDLVIDETGHVERAEVRRSVNRLYEAQLVNATRGWRYKPATQGGRPVKFSRTLEVTLTAREQ